MLLFTHRRLRLAAVVTLMLSMLSGPCFALNCVEYVRKVSGLDISGDAWEWWGNAGGRYERGHLPKESAILVFDHTGSMEHGHVAVVSKLMNPRLITINHANWAHLRSLKGHISTGVMVQDVSDRNDWSEVKVWDESSQSFGRSNRILGFVYNAPGRTGDDMVADNDSRHEEAEATVRDIDNE